MFDNSKNIAHDSAQVWLQCVSCGTRYDLGPQFFGCSACATRDERQALEVAYASQATTPDDAQPGVWRWHSLLPPVAAEHRITLHEGRTALLPLFVAAPQNVEVFLKNETQNPTWSWKDRPNSVSISMARHWNYQQVVAKSTGNHGNAVAAYATRAGLESTIFCHREAPDLQLALMQRYGAEVRLGGDQDTTILKMVKTSNYFPCTILCPRSGYTNPFGVEGFKTISFEIVEQLGGQAPDRVIVSVGSGDGIYGIFKGFRELHERGVIEKIPRITACQAEGADSLVRAWEASLPSVDPLTQADTVALSVSELVTGDHALQAVYDSAGSALTTSDETIIESQRELQRFGLALEPASALAYGCTKQLLRRYQPEIKSRGERWVIIGSGAAVKWPESLMAGYRRPEFITAEIPQLVPTT